MAPMWQDKARTKAVINVAMPKEDYEWILRKAEGASMSSTVAWIVREARLRDERALWVVVDGDGDEYSFPSEGEAKEFATELLLQGEESVRIEKEER